MPGIEYVLLKSVIVVLTETVGQKEVSPVSFWFLAAEPPSDPEDGSCAQRVGQKDRWRGRKQAGGTSMGSGAHHCQAVRAQGQNLTCPSLSLFIRKMGSLGDWEDTLRQCT